METKRMLPIQEAEERVEEEAGPCKLVRIVCFDSAEVPFALGKALIEEGARLGGCEVRYAKPRRCVVTENTSVSIVKHRRVWVENVDARYVAIHDEKSVYVYYRYVVEAIDKEVTALLSSKPTHVGLILWGPPGTGKSVLGLLISSIYGLYDIELSLGAILSKYVGETEQNIQRLINEARAAQPSMIFADEGEALVKSRSSETDHAVMNNVRNILLKETSAIAKNKEQVLIVVTTNMSPDEMDPAFGRSERFAPILVPNLDFKGMEILGELLREKLNLDLSGEEVRKLAIVAASIGLPVADFVGMVKGLTTLREHIRSKLMMETKVRSYLVPPKATEYVQMPCEELEYANRLTLHYTGYPQSDGLVAAIAAAGCGYQNIVLRSSEPQAVSEAVNRVKYNPNSVLIIEVPIDSSLFYAKLYSLPVPIIFTARAAPPSPDFSQNVPIRVTAPDKLAQEFIEMYGVGRNWRVGGFELLKRIASIKLASLLMT